MDIQSDFIESRHAVMDSPIHDVSVPIQHFRSNEGDRSALARALTAEFIGTFSLIFIGAGAATALGVNRDPPVAFAHGFAIMVFAAAFGDISGCHINPAVTVGLAAAGKFPARRVVPYILVQLLGAIAAGYTLLFVFGGPVSNLGATLIDTQRITYTGAFALEALGTFFLVNTVLQTAVRQRANRLAPVAIGMTVTMCILCFGALTGGSVNPARTIGPAVATGIYDGIAVYLAAQLVGAACAGSLYRWFWVRTAANGGSRPPSAAAIGVPGLHRQAPAE
jgi:MIP family channel proteins